MDIVILVFLVFRIIKLARLKGLRPFKWGALLVLNWFMFELLGLSLATSVLNVKLDVNMIQADPNFFILLSLFALGCGILGYYITKIMMNRAIV